MTPTAQANWGSVAVVASGSVLDAAGDSTGATNVFANGLRVSASSLGAQGANPNAIETEVLTLAVSAGAGGINVADDSALNIGSVGAVLVNRVTGSGGVTAVPDPAESALVGLSTTASSNGSIVARSTTLTVSNAVSANGSGNVLLQAQAGTLAVNAAVGSGSGPISLLSAGPQSYGAAGDISTGGAGELDVSAGGAIVMNAGTVLQTAGGDIRLRTTGAVAGDRDITLAVLDARPAGDR